MDTNVAASTGHANRRAGAALVLTIVGSAVLSGVGLLGLMYWLLTQSWVYFLSLVPLTAGAYLLFTRATGADRA